MRRTILGFLMVGVLTATVSATGCRSVPTAVVKTIADIDSSSRATNEDFRRVLGGYAPTAEEKKHWTARSVALDDLTPKAAKWAQDNAKE